MEIRNKSLEELTMLSICCGAPPLFGWHKEGDTYSGICSACKENCEFTLEEDEDA